MTNKTALMIGNTSGIGAEVTKKLLALDFRVVGVSKSSSSLHHPHYRHFLQDVSATNYRSRLNEILVEYPHIDLCIYFAGIGDQLDWTNLRFETRVFEVNLLGAVITTEIVLTAMQNQDNGHFIGISSMADELTSPDAPSYSATKAGISRYWEGLGIAAKSKSINVSNIRFGFVDTKMAKSPVKPFLMSLDQAAEFILKVIKRPRIRATKPIALVPLVWLLRFIVRAKLLLR